MKHAKPFRVLSVILCAVMLISMIPFGAFAVSYDETVDDYYNVISKNDWELSPGITESEIVLNNDAGSQRQVLHVVEADATNEYVKVMPSYAGMKEALDAQEYKTQGLDEQAAWAEANGYGNVVAAMNLSLSWYTSDYYVNNPQLIGEPLGYLVMDGQVYTNSQGQSVGAQTCVVINFDEKDGVARPDDIPKTQIRSTADPITGWEEQVIPASFGFIVKDGKSLYTNEDHTSNAASRSFIGIKADGTIISVMNDGRQAPYSTGLNYHEMAEVMLSLGCVAAVNGDGGGSSTFLSQRPGEELELHCSPSDGSVRPTTGGVFFISTAPATGEFVRANITTENKYFTPGSTVTFSALGTDLVGTEAEIPADVAWQLKEADMGTIENGVFVSNGTIGTATAQMVYNGAVVGECAVEIVIPEEFGFTQSTMTVPFGKEVSISLTATINDGIHEVVLKDSDVSFSLDNEALGTVNGLTFTSVDEANAPETLTGTLTATLNCAGISSSVALTLGKGSDVIFDFENGADDWNSGEVNKKDQYGEGASYVTYVEGVNSDNGEVHNGNGALKVHLDGMHSIGNPADGVTQVGLYPDESVIVTGAKSLGFWIYIPEDYYHAMIRLHYWYDSNSDGTYDKKNTVILLNAPTIYNTADDDGWYYLSTDISKYDSIMIKGPDGAAAAATDASNYRFIEIMNHHTGGFSFLKDVGTSNGVRDIYVDNITADYSEAVDDREAPVFNSVTLTTSTENEYAMAKRAPVTTTDNVLNVIAAVAENTTKANATGLNVSSARAYVDGVAVPVKFANGRLSISNVKVADGMHRVRFEISDNAGNEAVVVRLVNVQSGVDASTVVVAPHDATLDKLYGGSVYWMDVKATDIETINSVKTVIDLNSVNHWELDYTQVADGFTMDYVVDDVTNSATITITRTGDNTQTGEAVLASLPIRIVSYSDFSIAGYDEESYWNTVNFWPQDLKVDVDMGIITYVDAYSADVSGTFSNEEFAVDTELYTNGGSMDATYKAEKGSCHVHTPVAVDDKVATCTEKGYTGRTYCDVCESVVDWGTDVPATGHIWDDESAVVRECTACDVVYGFDANGNVMQTGWYNIDGKDYYCYGDGIMANGSADVDGKTYGFTDYVLTKGAWTRDDVGRMYFWAGKNFENDWYEIEGKKYHFKGKYADIGIVPVSHGLHDWNYYFFDGAGALREDLNGIYNHNGDLYYAENGKFIYAGLVQDDDGNYYYINSSFKAVKGTYYVTKTNNLLPAGEYVFGDDCKMIRDNGFIVDADGSTRYYVNGEYVTGLQIIDGKYYYFSTHTGAMRTGEYTVNPLNANGLFEVVVTFIFAEDGSADYPINLKNGFVKDDDGATRYYVNGQYLLGLQKINGKYYYFSTHTGAMRTGEYTLNPINSNGMFEVVVTFNFAADGSSDGPIDLKEGFVKDSDGATRYYVNGQYVTGLQVINGKYYYFSTHTGAMRTGEYTVNPLNSNGLFEVAATFNFAADGSADTATNLKNGFVAENGVTRYYINGVYVKGLQNIDGKYYYFSSNNGQMRTGNYVVGASNSNGLLTSGKSFVFDTTYGYAVDANGNPLTSL